MKNIKTNLNGGQGESYNYEDVKDYIFLLQNLKNNIINPTKIITDF